jgi:murein DD-endopeptidase MepM/ murein hydrolase activator NlpD
LRNQTLSTAGFNQVYCDPKQLVAAAGQMDSAQNETEGDGSDPKTPKKDSLVGLSGSALQQHRARQYLARIALGETDNGTNVGDRATAESVNGPYGIYQFKSSSRNSLLQLRGLDAWSADPEEQAQAAWAWIQIIGNEEGVDLHQTIASGDFATADQVLGRDQFTSLPGGAEASRHWQDPSKLEQYGPNGDAPDVGTAPLPTSPGGMPCNSTAIASTDSSGSFTEGSGVSTGQLISPVDGVETSPYGNRVHPIKGISHFHTGKDYGAPLGAPVKAADGGTVIDVENACEACTRGYGFIVRIRHENGLETLYAHLNDAYPNIGDKVDKGQIIGAVGSTGRSTGPHLHFEVRNGPGYGNNHLDPDSYLR